MKQKYKRTLKNHPIYTNIYLETDNLNINPKIYIVVDRAANTRWYYDKTVRHLTLQESLSIAQQLTEQTGVTHRLPTNAEAPEALRNLRTRRI